MELQDLGLSAPNCGYDMTRLLMLLPPSPGWTVSRHTVSKIDQSFLRALHLGVLPSQEEKQLIHDYY